MANPYPLYLDLFELAIASATEPQRNLHFPLFHHAATRVPRSPRPRRGRPRGTHEKSRSYGTAYEVRVDLVVPVGVGARTQRVSKTPSQATAMGEPQLSFDFGDLIANAVVLVERPRRKVSA
jgi:hypothetical protein